MTVATPVTPNNGFPPSALPEKARSASPWWCRTLSTRIAAGMLGASVLGCAGAIEVARAWTDAPHAAAEAGQVVGGVLVALFVTAALALLTRATAFGGLAVAAVFALAAHGGTLVLEGQLVGSLFLGLTPVAALLAHVTFATDDVMETAAARDAVMRARMLALWMKTSRRKTVRAAPPAASPIPLAMRASQVTTIDAWVTEPRSSSRGSATPRSCASNV